MACGVLHFMSIYSDLAYRKSSNIDTQYVKYAETICIGLSTVYRIDGIMVAVYGVRNHPVRVPSRFVPYTAMAHILLYFTAVNTVRVMTYKTCIS
jgi:hypothetical protein